MRECGELWMVHKINKNLQVKKNFSHATAVFASKSLYLEK